MATDAAGTPWTLTMPPNTVLQRNISLTVPLTGAAYNLTGVTAWEYVVRISATDAGTPLVSVTTTANSQGVITILSATTAPQLLITLNPAATASLAPSQYWHGLWSSPGTVNQFCWLKGNLIIDGTAQP